MFRYVSRFEESKCIIIQSFLQHDPDPCPDLLPRGDLEVAAVLVHDPLGDGKSQARSLEAAGLVRAVKALKHVRHVRLRHADAGSCT